MATPSKKKPVSIEEEDPFFADADKEVKEVVASNAKSTQELEALRKEYEEQLELHKKFKEEVESADVVIQKEIAELKADVRSKQEEINRLNEIIQNGGGDKPSIEELFDLLMTSLQKEVPLHVINAIREDYIKLSTKSFSEEELKRIVDKFTQDRFVDKVRIAKKNNG